MSATAGPLYLVGSFRRWQTDVCRLRLFPQSVAGIADLLERHAQRALVLSSVDYVAHVGGRNAERGLSWLARAGGVRWWSRTQRDDAITIPRDCLGHLLAGISHWNLHCWDAPEPPAPLELSRLTRPFAHGAKGPGRDRPALHRLEAAWFFVDSHDDTDLTVETRGPALACAVFARAAASLVQAAGATAGAGTGPPPTAPLPDALIQRLWSGAPTFELRASPVPARPGRVRITYAPLSAGHIALPGSSEPLGHVEYDPDAAAWRHRYR